MSDPISREESWLRGALRAEEATLPVRLRPEDLGRRWGERRRRRTVRRVGLAAAAMVVVAVGLGAMWAMGQRGNPIESQPVVAGPISGPISYTQTPATGPGLSVGRATLTLSQPKSSPGSFAVGCIWSVSGHVVGLSIGKQQVGGESLFVRWKLAAGPKYQIELVEPDQTIFVGLAGNYASQATADGLSGSISFTDLTLNAGDPATAPRRSGTFTWTCERAAKLGQAAPTLGSPTAENGVPTLWIVQNGTPTRRTLTGCPIDLRTVANTVTTSCATANWWEPLRSLNSTLEVAPGDSLAFALDGWTVTSANVVAMPASSAGGPSVNSPLVDLRTVLGNGVVDFSPPGGGDWFVHFTVEAAKDDGSTLDAEYSYPISVP
jgi:hypothetical protein